MINITVANQEVQALIEEYNALYSSVFEATDKKLNIEKMYTRFHKVICRINMTEQVYRSLQESREQFNALVFQYKIPNYEIFMALLDEKRDLFIKEKEEAGRKLSRNIQSGNLVAAINCLEGFLKRNIGIKAFFHNEQTMHSLWHALVKYGRVEREQIESFKQYEDINRRSNRGNSTLHYASKYANFLAFENFIAAGFSLESQNIIMLPRNREGKTPFHIAAENGKVNFILSIIKKYPQFQVYDDLMATDNNGDDIIHLLVRGGYVTELLKISQAFPFICLSGKNTEEYTPLMLAIRYGNINLVRILLQAGVDLEEQDHLGNTALHWAVKRGCLEITKLLVAEGACLTRRNTDDKTPKDLGNKYKRFQIFFQSLNFSQNLLPIYGQNKFQDEDKQIVILPRYLSEQVEKFQPILNVPKHCPALVLAFYQEHDPLYWNYLHFKLRIPITTRDLDGNTAFHIAVKQGDLIALQRLYEQWPLGLFTTNFANQAPKELANAYGYQAIVNFIYQQANVLRVINQKMNASLKTENRYKRKHDNALFEEGNKQPRIDSGEKESQLLVDNHWYEDQTS